MTEPSISTVVRVDPSLVLGSEAHAWTVAPFHYVDGYYEALRDGLAKAGVHF
jgi:hypothetical protein